MRRNGLFIIMLYVSVILILHIIPTGAIRPDVSTFSMDFQPDYIIHLLMFLPWMSAGLILMEDRICCKSYPSMVFWCLLGLFIAAGSEALQIASDFRVFNPVDMMLNIAGVIIGWLPARLLLCKGVLWEWVRG